MSRKTLMPLALAILAACSLNAQSQTKPQQSTLSASQPATYGPWRSSKIGGGGYIQNVVLCPSNANRAYAYVDVGGLYRSDDGGRRWKMLHGNLPALAGAYEVRGLSVDPRDDRRVLAAIGSQWSDSLGMFESRDAGETWSKVLSARYMGNGPERWTGFIITRHPQNPNVLLTAAEGTGVFRSSDGGTSWSKQGMENLHCTDIRFDAQNPKRVWLCAQPFNDWLNGEKKALAAGFYRSEDGGAQWTKLSAEAPTETLQVPWETQSILGVFKGRVQISADAGTSWKEFSIGLPPSGDDGNTSESRFQSFAAGPNFVLTASQRGTFYRWNKGETSWRKIERQGVEEIYEGEPWMSRMQPGKWQHFGAALGSITIDAKNPNHWFFTDWFAIYETLDAGKNWRLSMDGVEVTVLHTLVQAPDDAGVVHLGMADNGYLYSENGGERFHSPHANANMKSIAVSRALPNRIYGAGDRGNGQWKSNQVWVSINRGRSWTKSPMQGLPDMEANNCNTIAVDPRDPYHVYLALSHEVKPGSGGVWESRDGGKSWTWMGQGLPPNDSFFAESIWGIGREIAVDAGGDLVAISRDKSKVFRFDAAAKNWTSAIWNGGKPWSGQPDPQTAKRFWIGSSEGVVRSDDGGATWAKVLSADARHVAIDAANSTRLAVGTAEDIMLSVDSGANWKAVATQMPHRTYPLVAFAGERLLAGTSGSGAFWMPLSPQGEKPIAAKPVVVAAVQSTLTAIPTLHNAQMNEGAATPTGWNAPWSGEGKIAVARDVADFKSGPASLRLQSEGGRAYGSIGQNLKLPNDVTAAFRVRGWAKSRGDLQEALIAVQVFDAAGKQIEWKNLAGAAAMRNWSEFSADLQLPANTVKAQLLLTLKGDGAVWLDDISIEAAPTIFPTAPL